MTHSDLIKLKGRIKLGALAKEAGVNVYSITRETRPSREMTDVEERLLRMALIKLARDILKIAE